MKYSDIVKKDKNLCIETNCGKLNVVYNQTFFTKENSIFSKPDWKNMLDIDFAIACLTGGLLVKWDLENDSGKTISITAKELTKLNEHFIIDLYKILQEDAGSFFKRR